MKQQTTKPDEKSIRKVAHDLWVQRGCPSGSPELDWFQAEQMLLAEQAPSVASTKVARSEPPRRAAGNGRSRKS